MNKPVAWMYRMKNSGNKWELIFNKPMSDEFFETIPLYTHPVKELTDEEIIKLFENDELWARSSIVYQDDAINFAKAILKKARE